ncbi:MAG: protein kinase domain-containing protein [Rubripirellula sp.]
MTDSSSDNYPIADAPTRDIFSVDENDEGIEVDGTPLGGEIPKEVGDYEIKRLIGSGGMGQVYLAEHVRMQRIVAIKTLPLERMQDKRSIDRFYQEVRTASRVMHPNIVTAFDAGEDGGVHYLAMEFIDGDTLSHIVAKEGPFSVGQAAAIIRQAALGLLHAHRAGIVHRDVKPGNLMRSVDGTIKVLDLGLATISNASLIHEDLMEGNAQDEQKKKGRLVGTLPFMSPEQLEDSSSPDSRGDIYSLGATFYFLLTGRPPFTGEFLDLVNGHRHGEIPDLMQVRDDVDLGLATIFNRMMAKSPDERYASLDEVIDDLNAYSSDDEAPMWMTEFTKQRRTTVESSTVSGGSTKATTSDVLGIDFGMFYSAAAKASSEGEVSGLTAGGPDQPIFRMAVASHDNELVLGNAAMDRRMKQSQNIAHSIPIYIGKLFVEREIAGRQCPPEVLLAMLFRQMVKNSWPEGPPPLATAITVPGSYDQLHRRSVLQAAKIAGLTSVRLVDRSVAVAQSLVIDSETTAILDETLIASQRGVGKPILFVGVSGQATDVALFRWDSTRLHQLSKGGHWHTGTLPWLHRLVDMAADAFRKEHGFDPREISRYGARLQIACERAMNSMLLMPNVKIKIQRSGKMLSVAIDRRHWLQRCEELAAGVRQVISQVCEAADISSGEVELCFTQGPLMRMPTLRDAVLRDTPHEVACHSLDRSDAARGAAACVASELPGRGDFAKPPRIVSGQSIGIVVEDAKNRRRILPIIPRGTGLPARTNRRLTVGKERDSMTLSLVESSGIDGSDWHSLGRYAFQVDESNPATRMIGFELDFNGLLTVRAQEAGSLGSKRLRSLPDPPLSDERVAEWTEWLDGLMAKR